MRNESAVGKPLVVFGESQIEQVKKLASVLTKVQLADYMEVCENTFRAIEARQPEVATAYRSGKAKAISGVANNLINAAENGSVTAAMFYLRTQAGWREQETTTVTASTDNVIQIIRAVKPD